jgi:hypothetical protein
MRLVAPWMLASLMLALPAQAGDFASPESSFVIALGSRIDRLQRVEVSSAGRRFFLDGPRVVAEGLRYRALTMREGFSYRRVEPRQAEAALLPWSGIDAIRAGRGNAGRGAWIGGLLGLGIGLAVAANQPCHPGFILSNTPSNCGPRMLSAIVGCTLAGAATGAIVGNRGERWTRIYP